MFKFVQLLAVNRLLEYKSQDPLSKSYENAKHPEVGSQKDLKHAAGELVMFENFGGTEGQSITEALFGVARNGGRGEYSELK